MLRVLLVAGAIALAVAGFALLTHGTPAQERRLGRVGVILLVMAVVAAYAGLRGRL